MVLRIFAKTLIKLLGFIKDQGFWQRLHFESLRSMNYGNGADFHDSGELFVIKYIQSNYSKGTILTLFDVGGNIGNYSKALSDIFKANAFIHAFEPSAKTYATFLNTTQNCNNIIPNNLGMSNVSSSQLLFTNQDDSGFASVYQRNLEHYGISMDTSEEIKLTTIDDYCKLHNINHIHFLKLDIEGHELKALQGATNMIASKKIDYIQFEFGGCNIDSKTYFQDFFYLLKDNFKIYRILQNGLFEIQQYRETLEIFLTVNYLAIKK